MQAKKIKLLWPGHKGILLKTVPKTIESLFKIVEHYYKIDPASLLLTFFDNEKDECEITDDNTYKTACSESSHKVTIHISLQNKVSDTISCSYIFAERKSLKYFKKKTRKMAFFDIQSGTAE